MPKCQMKSDPKLKFDFFKFMKQKFIKISICKFWIFNTKKYKMYQSKLPMIQRKNKVDP